MVMNYECCNRTISIIKIITFLNKNKLFAQRLLHRIVEFKKSKKIQCNRVSNVDKTIVKLFNGGCIVRINKNKISILSTCLTTKHVMIEFCL